jgi:hypothetical protein
MQEVVLNVENDSLDHVESLGDWLLREPELRGCVTPRTRPPAAGEMGPVVDAIAIAAGSGGALTVLAASLRTWLAHPRRSDVKIKIRGADGRTVEVDAKRVADVPGLVREVVEAQREPDTDAAT